ncbi:hypothetical protein [Aliivibrio fischeri]|uniref:hypothetical protein n=1 Tax=Aliivibrio fischeri TaxID=668 RepID=UPI0012DA091A|nr:hypothetical protein [Aliivibrio fischeri]MUK70249.1 hypothetical protein [Aliivibrio fischeri]MUK72087.1 hypothetical protein [Aliivibrio fischeri]
MWKLFESDRLILAVCIISLLFSGVIINQLFFSSFDVVYVISLLANIATILAAIFGFWVYTQWKKSQNNIAVHNLILDFITELQGYDLVIIRLLSHRDREQFIIDYDEWANVYLKLMMFKKSYTVLTNEINRTSSFMELGFTELAFLEGRFSKLRTVHIYACNDFDIDPDDGANLLFDFLQGNTRKNGKFNRFHKAWTNEINYQILNFSSSILELQMKLHK